MNDVHHQLAASEARLRAVMAGMKDSFHIMDAVRNARGIIQDFRFVELNAHAARHVHRSASDLVGKLRSEIDPSNQVIPFDELVRTVEAREECEGELHVTEPGQAPVWLHYRVFPMNDGVGVHVADITERRRIDRERDLHSVVLMHMNEGVCVVRASDAIIVSANPKFEEIFGYSPGELDGRPISILNAASSGRSGEALAAEILAQLRQYGEATCEVQNVRKDGTEILCRAMMTTVQHPDHGAVWVTVQEDITEQRRAQEARSQTEASFKLLAERAPTGMLLTYADGELAFANPALLRMLAYDAAEEIVGRPARDIVWPADRALIASRMQARFRGEENGSPLEFRLIRKAGTQVLVEGIGVELTFEGRRALMVIVRNLTAQRAAEEATQASLHEKEVLLKEIHHRVKNNLQVISSLIGLQAAQIEDADARRVFEETQGRVRSIALLHEKLYQSRDLASIVFEEYLRDLTTTIFRTAGALASGVRCEVRSAGLRLEVDEAVPCALIVNELVTNSLKHAWRASGQAPVEGKRILVEMTHEDGSFTLIVSDNGSGLASSVDLRTAKSLGLHLVRTLTRQLGGKVTLSTSSGARCTITFPVTPIAKKEA